MCGVLHLVVEDLGFSALSRGDQVAVKALKNVLADLGQLGLDLLAVLLDKSNLGLVALGLLLLLDRGDNSPGGAASTDDVLIGNGKEISLLDGELLVCRGNSLHVLDHLCRTGLEYNAVPHCRCAYPHNARPARPAWPGTRSLRNPL